MYTPGSCGLQRAWLAEDDEAEITAKYISPNGVPMIGREGIHFLWHPWANNTAAGWYRCRKASGASASELAELRRLLGRFVMKHKGETLQRARSQWSYIAGETLGCLAELRL